MKPYINIDLENAQPGMKLWDAVVDAKGATLLPAGTELTASLITSLSRRGVYSVDVVDDRVNEADLRVQRERVEKRLQNLFRRTGHHATARLLMQSILAYRCGEKT